MQQFFIVGFCFYWKKSLFYLFAILFVVCDFDFSLVFVRPTIADANMILDIYLFSSCWFILDSISMQMRSNRSCMKHLHGCLCVELCLQLTQIFCEHLTVWYICLFWRWHVSVHGYHSFRRSVHVHYIRRSRQGATQHVCTAVCSVLSAPAGSAIPIYPSATEAGGKSAEHHCQRFHIRRTRLPVGRPLCGSDEGGRRQGHSVGGAGTGVGGGWSREGRWEGGQRNSAPPWDPWTLCFSGSFAAKLHICLTPGTVVFQSGAVCPDSHPCALQFVLRICVSIKQNSPQNYKNSVHSRHNNTISLTLRVAAWSSVLTQPVFECRPIQPWLLQRPWSLMGRRDIPNCITHSLHPLCCH